MQVRECATELRGSGTSRSLGLSDGVEGGSIKDEQAANDLPVLDGHAFGSGRALHMHRFGVVHDDRLLAVTKGGN
jgi:hypothetical protein